MNKVIIFAENFEGVFKKATFEAVSYGSRIVEQMGGGEVIAISLGEVADEELKSLGAYGATRVISLHNEAFNSLDAKPNALPIAYTVPSIRLYCFCVMSSATPNIVQLVVIRGKKTPSA
jgi:electron transfer flavoprotein alpha/beta subunit